MTERAALPAGIAPRLLSRDEAAAYVGLSPNAFDQEVKAGTFPRPVPLAKIARVLWDRKALDLALDAKMTTVVDLSDAWDSRKARWKQRREDRSQASG